MIHLKVRASISLFCAIAILLVLLSLNLYKASHATFATCPFSSSDSASQSMKNITDNKEKFGCDYYKGKWVRHEAGPLYNDSCTAMKDTVNCLKNGRPDKEYLNWRWKPNSCDLPRFDPYIFLQILTNKHIAFIGDSLSWNQLESLICLVSSFSTPKLLHETHGVGRILYKKWEIESNFNVTISGYWSPLLVQSKERNFSFPNNQIYLDRINEHWYRDYHLFDTVVITVGRWFYLPGLYYVGEKNSVVLGCHYCEKLNYKEIEVSHMYKRVLKIFFNAIVGKMKTNARKGNHVIFNSYLPIHYEGAWDKNGTCPRTLPYEEDEKDMEPLDVIMKEAAIEELEAASKEVSKIGNFRLELMDITKMSWLRSDAHPGPYMRAFPFVNHTRDMVQYDCLHWCLPGAVDTWNEILLQLIKRWWVPSRKQG